MSNELKKSSLEALIQKINKRERERNIEADKDRKLKFEAESELNHLKYPQKIYQKSLV